MDRQLRDLEYFSVVAERGNVGRAAESLGLSQPALSKSLRRLEESMEAKLFKRTSKGVELTAVGAALLSQVRRLRLMLDDVTREVADLSHGRAGNLHIGTIPGLASDLLPVACSALVKDAANMTLKITVAGRSETISALRDGHLDLIVAGIRIGQDHDLVQHYLYDDEFGVFSSPNHRLARKKHVSLKDLSEERWALTAPSSPSWQRFHQAFADGGLPPPRITIQANSTALRLPLVSFSNLLFYGSRRVLREAAARVRLSELAVAELAWSRRVGVMYRKDAYLSPAARRFIE
ncbi:MAG: LysR family transcriptional regulator, partial [Burkholderiales bacterium]